MQSFIIFSFRTTNVVATDGRWHHICSTWENTVGSWQLLKDGIAKASGTNLQKGSYF